MHIVLAVPACLFKNVHSYLSDCNNPSTWPALLMMFPFRSTYIWVPLFPEITKGNLELLNFDSLPTLYQLLLTRCITFDWSLTTNPPLRTLPDKTCPRIPISISPSDTDEVWRLF